MSESRTVCSLIAIVPDVEFKKPSLTVSPSTHVSPEADSPPDESLDPHPTAKSESEPTAATTISGRNRVFPNMKNSFRGRTNLCEDPERRSGRCRVVVEAVSWARLLP
jgi:hypothetical protein